MNDKNKTKAQLIAELQELRGRVAQLETAATSRQDHAPLRAMAETAASAIFIFQDSVFCYTNPATSKLSGYAEKELLGTNVWDLVHPEHRELMKERLRDWLHGEPVPSRSEFKILTRSGETRWIDADTSLIEFDGKPAALTIAYESTLKKLAEEALMESEQRVSKIIETAQEAIWIVDAKANTTYANERLAEMLGYKTDELVGCSVFDFVDDADRLEAIEVLKRGRNGIRQQNDFRFRRKDGSEVWTMVSTTPLFDSAGEFVGGLAMLIDVTERRRSEEALKESEARMQAAIENLPFELWARDRDGRCIIQNPYSVSQWGDFLGTLPVDIAPDGETLRVWDTINRRAYAGEVVRGESQITRGEQALWYYYTVSPIRVDGQIRGILGVNIDITDRKKAEEALRQSEAKFRVLTQTVPSVIFIFQDSKIVYANSYAEAHSGYSEQELRSMDFWAMVHPEHRQLAKERGLARLRGEPVPARYELKLVTKTGEERWVDFAASPMTFEGKPAVLGTALDITERKLAEEAVHQTEKRYRELVENARDIIYSHDLNGKYTSVNKAVEQITGYTREEALQRNFAATVAPEYIETARQMIAAKLAGEKETVYDLEIIAKDGRRITVEVNTRLVFQDDVPIGVQGIARDVTARKRAEEALRESQAHLQAILDNCPAMIFQKDLNGRYLQVNRQFERTFNIHSDQVLGQTDDELFPPEFAGALRASDQSVLEAGRALEFEESAVSSDGRHTYIVHKFPLLDAAGEVYAVGGISTDITARKRTEDDLRKQKEILQKIFDHIPVMIRFLDEDGRVKLVNREWERRLGWSLKEIEAADVDIFAALYPDPDYRRHVLGFVGASTGEFTDFKTRTKEGRVIDTNFANVRLDDGTNIGIGRDITDQKRAADQLRRQTAQLAALHEIEREISAESDLSRILEVVTQRAAGLLDASHCSTYIRDREDATLTLAASLESRFIGVRLREGEGLAGIALATGEAQAVDDYSTWQGRAAEFDGAGFGPTIAAPLKWQQTVIGAISISRKRDGEQFTPEDTRLLKQLAAEAAIAIHQATLFDEVQESRRRLQTLSHRLIDAQEAERKRLSIELHDQIGQALTAVQISLQGIQSSYDGATAGPLDDCLSIIDDALQQVHDLSLDLRPSLLDDLGLVTALRWYVDRVAQRAGIMRCFSADALQARLAPQVETACFRIAQEALTNVVRHAQAATVWVQITQHDSGLQLVVHDDGIGFDVRAATRRTGVNASLGLQGMQERAAALGGSVEIKSQRGNGVEVLASFPLALAH
jgi:PAS domain S-box-containing protein